MLRAWWLPLSAVLAWTLSGCGNSGEEALEVERIDADKTQEGQLNIDLATVQLHEAEGERPKVAYVTNGVASFWTIAAVGARKAGEDVGCDVDVRFPGKVDEQKQTIETLVLDGIDGIAVSMIDAQSQAEVVDAAAKQTNIITQDSDCPDSQRLSFVGMNNYLAGRMCGELVLEAIPDGGSVAIFVGRVGQDNARRRRQGVVDVLLDRPFGGFDKVTNQKQVGEKYTILGTRTDNFDRAQAKNNAEDVISRYGDELDCMVGLFAYNPPACLEAIKGAGKLGEIALVGFDEDDATLQAILDGECQGTVVQNPYEYGYQSVKLLAALAKGDRSAFPEKGFLDIPALQIRKDNCQEFWDDLKGKLAAGESGN